MTARSKCMLNLLENRIWGLKSIITTNKTQKSTYMSDLGFSNANKPSNFKNLINLQGLTHSVSPILAHPCVHR